MTEKVLNLEGRIAKLHIVLAQIASEHRGVKAIEDAEQLYEKLWHAVREHTKTAPVEHASRALAIFHDSYHVHRDKYGSYKGFCGSEDYGKLMAERYLFCYEQAMKYLGKHVYEQNDNE